MKDFERVAKETDDEKELLQRKVDSLNKDLEEKDTLIVRK